MDLDAVRTFVAAADAGRFQDAAAGLSVTQQAVSKRIAALERDLGVRLFVRTPRGSRLTVDGQAFLPHARELLRAEERAADAVRPGRRALRVDVIASRIAPATLLRAFHDAHPGTPLDVVHLTTADAALAALADGTVDAAFRAVVRPGGDLPDGVVATRVLDEPLELVVGPAHPLAGAPVLAPSALAGHRILMPGLVPGSEWAAYYDELAAAFGLTVDPGGPNFGAEALLDDVAGSDDLATFMGEGIRVDRLAGPDLRRIPLRDPAPVYPHALVRRRDHSHPALAALRDFLASPAAVDAWRPDGGGAPGRDAAPAVGRTWTPSWAR